MNSQLKAAAMNVSVVLTLAFASGCAPSVAETESNATYTAPGGKCPANLKVGDVCAEGICSNGKKNVFKCDANRECKERSEQKC